MTAQVSDVSALPIHVLLGLTTGDADAERAREMLSKLHESFPRLAVETALDLTLSALRLVENGHRDPQRLARDVRTVCSAAGGRWAR